MINEREPDEDEGDFPFEKIAEKFNVSLKRAAKEFGLSKSSLKRRCRKCNIKQWPFRKVYSQACAFTHIDDDTH